MSRVIAKNGSVKEPKIPKSRFEYVSKKEGNEILDRAARKHFGISGEEFVRRYKDGSLSEEDNLAFDRVATLIPLSEYQ